MWAVDKQGFSRVFMRAHLFLLSFCVALGLSACLVTFAAAEETEPPVSLGTIPLVAEEEAAVPVSAGSPVVSASQKGEKKILDVLDLKNMDILDVLKLISQKSGLNIVAGQNVKGRGTVFL